jgi:hypothetical protein
VAAYPLYAMAVVNRWGWVGVALSLLPLTGCPALSRDRPDVPTAVMVEFIEPTSVDQWTMPEPLLFETAADFSEGMAAVRWDDRLAYIDHGGSLTVAVADANIEVVGNFVEGRAVARAGEYYGYIDTTGDWRIQIQFRQAKDFSEGLAAVQKERFYGFINRQGDWVVEPQFELADGFAQGLAAVKQDGLYGYVDITGAIVDSRTVPRCLAVCQ